ncbi:hypothetical protein D1007_04376 [Hordeum vulgare]|uniref:F-box domain-containing protein n=1 Tax=Hordeum vulgare subsp. vulgare TaxID=112509 RepID=A0A8I6Z890_HORVV|nr:hypothetical protein D1007_04376 [Hordeum vulgare]
MEEPMSRLTHDLIAEILSRVPYKSLCICKCVCPAWRGIIADPANRKKMAQTLAGFFYRITADNADPRGFAVNYADLSATVAETYQLLPPPPDSTDCFVSLEGSCDGLFLTSIHTGASVGTPRYMVSNPATGEYIVLPHSGYIGYCSSVYLGFDSGVSIEEFHLFEFMLEPCQSRLPRGLNIYSSKTGVWVSMQSQWDSELNLCWGQPGVFHKGCLHLLIHQSGLAIVDAQGLRWRVIPLPISVDPNFGGFIGKSAGQLFYIDSDGAEGHGSDTFSSISVYVLGAEIYQRDVTHLDDKCMHWKLLRKLSNVAPNKMFQLGFDLEVVGVHPHANTIFFIAHWNNELIAYDLVHQESTVVYHVEPNYQKFRHFFSYVPLFSRLPLDGGIRLATPI